MTATRNFFQNVKILLLAEKIENTYNYITHANFNRDSPKISSTFKLLLKFLRRILILGSYVLGAKIKLLI